MTLSLARFAQGTLLAVLIISLLAWGASHRREAQRLRDAARVVAIRTDSIEAARDTSRVVAIAVLHDSLRAVQRRVIQVTQRADSLDRAIGLERVAKYQIVARIAPLPAVDSAAPSPAIRDSAVFEARVSCDRPNASGIRPATLTVTGPRWADLRIASVEQDPRVCSPPPALPRVASRFGVTVGYSIVIAGDRLVRGPSIGLTFRIWP
jgi:hypothetical protein